MQQQCRVYGPYRNRKRWIVRVRSFASGKPVEAVESFDSRAAAQAHREELERQLDATDAYRRAAQLQAQADRAYRQAEALAGRRRTVAEAADAFETYQRRKGNKPTSVQTTRHRLRALLTRAWDEPIVTVSERRTRELYDARVADGVAAATHRYELKAARQLWTWLVKQGWAFDNPFAAIEPVGRIRRGKEQLRQHEARRFARLALA
jgi:multidrug efflux pump subunit AcrA (membrane-fusion protein)